MPQYQDLYVPGGVAAGKQHHPAEQPDHEQVDEANEPTADDRSPGQVLCTSSGTPQAGNRDMPHFTQICPEPAWTPSRER